MKGRFEIETIKLEIETINEWECHGDNDDLRE